MVLQERADDGADLRDDVLFVAVTMVASTGRSGFGTHAEPVCDPPQGGLQRRVVSWACGASAETDLDMPTVRHHNAAHRGTPTPRQASRREKRADRFPPRSQSLFEGAGGTAA
jgi:hypothetical protein